MFSTLELQTRKLILRENPGAAVMVLRRKTDIVALIGGRIVTANNARELINNVRATDPVALTDAILRAKL